MRSKTNKTSTHSEIVKVIYDRMKWAIINIEDSFPEEKKLSLEYIKNKLDKGKVVPEALQNITQSCIVLYHLKGVLNDLTIGKEFRKMNFESKCRRWSQLIY